MEKIEAVGKNVEKAIENGLQELNVTRDKVNIEVIDAGGLFKKARVLLTVEDETQEQDLIKNGSFISKSILLEDEKIDFKEYDRQNIDNNENLEDKENFEECKQEEVLQDLKVEETIEIKNEETVKDNFDFSVGAKTAKDFLQGYLKLISIDAEFEINEDADAIKIDIVGRDTNKIIGKHGDGLNALQYLSNVIANKADRNCGRVYIDTCGYKEKREQELIKLARKLKFSVLREEKPVKLEPMSAYDRKIIHKALHDDDSVETHSEGEEPKRYVVITLKEKVEENG